MIPLLKCIASAYNERYQDLTEFCFLFPNKRASKFFKKYLMEETEGRTVITPETYSIKDFIGLLSEKIEAPHIEQLFTLYNSYLEILNPTDEKSEGTTTFEAFRSWGEMVLSDFNIVDQYLVNSDEIFKNIKDYRQITSNFLTEDQKEVIEEYFGERNFGDTTDFWKSFTDPEEMTGLEKKFLSIWQVLGVLYQKFTENLEKKGYASSGGMYRLAYHNLQKEGKYILPFKKIVVIGFNALSTSEREIFKILKKEEGYPGYDEFTDFIWDATGPILTKEGNSASKFVISNMKRFPISEWIGSYLEDCETTDYPEIRIIGAPSKVSQVKIAGKLLKDFAEKGNEYFLEEAKTVLVLPDEQLLSSTLFSLPDEIGAVNLTMGYPFRQTTVSSYMSLLRRVYSTMRISGGEKLFFNKDLKLLMTHPYSYLIYGGDAIESLLDYINRHHKISLSIKEISDFIKEAEVTLNLPEKRTDADKMFKYLYEQIELLTGIMEKGPGNIFHLKLEKSHLNIYHNYLKILENSLKEYKIEISTSGILGLTERLLGSERINFDGEPLSGLQIMGTLETRSLDFKHVYILSMNEGTMPKRSRTRTFIPETLRRAYGLPPSYYSEEIFAYYFFRLISRAEKVTLIYDSRNTNGSKSGESRYLLQLKYLASPDKIKSEIWNFRLQASEKRNSSIKKDKKIKDLLNSYLTGEKNSRKNLSASSLNNYRECQVKFFFRNVIGLNSDPELGEFIDSITVGNILHESMMNLYLPKELRKKYLKDPVVINKEFIENILREESRIYSEVVRQINKHHYHLDSSEQERELPVSSEIIAEEICSQIEKILRHDLTLAPFELLGCEIQNELRIKLKSGKEVNFRFAIDRLDRINREGERQLRIVDYKTGSKKRSAETFEEVLRGDYRSEQIFQLLTYAWLLKKQGIPDSENVRTEIYYAPELAQGISGLPDIDGEFIEGFSQYDLSFSEGIESMIEEIFESDYFQESPAERDCGYCAFSRLCGK